MTKNNIKQALKRKLDPLFAANGFLSHPKHSCYYIIRDDVLSFVLLEPHSYGYECGMYVQPLYIPATTFILNLGDTVSHMEHRRRNRYALNNDLRRPELEANVKNLTTYLTKHAFPWFEKVGYPKGIRRYSVSRNRIGKRLFTQDVWRYEAKAYSELYLENHGKAQKYLEMFLVDLRKHYTSEWVAEHEKQVARLISMIRECPEQVSSVLQETVRRTRTELLL